MNKDSLKKIKKRVPYNMPQLEHYDSSTMIHAPEKFEAIIDQHINLLKKQGVDVAICPDYLNSFVENHIASLFNIIDSKHQENLDLIKSFFMRRAVDKKEFGQLLYEYKQEIASTYEEYKFVEELYEKHNPLHNGRLNLVPFSEGEENKSEEGSDDE